MSDKSLSQVLRERYFEVKEDAKNMASIEFKNDFENKYSHLDDFEQLGILCLMKEELDEEIKRNSHPYYINNDDEWVIRQFETRYFLLQKDESNELFYCLFINYYYELLNAYLVELIERLPKIEYGDFLNNKDALGFNHFLSLFNSELKDFESIFKWKIDKFFEIIEYDLSNFIAKYQNHLLSVKDPHGYLQNQISLLNSILVKRKTTATQIKKTLSKLLPFDNFDLNVFDYNLLMHHEDENFDKFYLLEPFHLKASLNGIDKKSTGIIGNEYTIFHSLVALKSWMSDSLKKSTLQEPFKAKDVSEELDRVVLEVENEVKIKTNEFREFCENNTNKPKKVKKFLKNKFLENINNYRQVGDIMFMIISLEYDVIKSILRYLFFDNKNNTELLAVIKETYFIKLLSYEIEKLFKELFGDSSKILDENMDLFKELKDLVSRVILDKDLYLELIKIHFSFIAITPINVLPICIHEFLLCDIYIKVFENCLIELEIILAQTTSNNKNHYLQQRLRELKHDELRYKISLSKTKSLSSKAQTYKTYFKEFLSIEAEYIKENINTPVLNTPVLVDTTKKLKYHSFTYKKWQSDPKNLTYLKESLIVKNLIAADTELKHFRKVFSGETIEKPIVWIGKISELSYFIKQLHNKLKYVENVKLEIWAVTINCFIQENGEKYNRQKLRTQKDPTTSKNIDNALKTLK